MIQRLSLAYPSPKGQPDLQIIPMQVDGPNLQPEAAKTIRSLLTDGKINGRVLQTSDCRKTYEELKGKGVEFLSKPKEQFYGVEATMRDNSGNWFSMMETKGA
jgi:Glyoxalase/Bleomycin resistance protein/Dioxygenase superfamily